MLDLHSINDRTDGRFSMRAGFYAGRGANLGDLNSPILEKLYLGVRQEAGDEIAANFVRFVNKLDDLSASAFIVAFERFAARDGKVVDVAQQRTDRNALDHEPHRDMQAFAVIAGAMFGRQRSPEEDRRVSDEIKAAFIRDHLQEIPEDERRETRDPYGYEPFGRCRRY